MSDGASVMSHHGCRGHLKRIYAGTDVGRHPRSRIQADPGVFVRPQVPAAPPGPLGTGPPVSDRGVTDDVRDLGPLVEDWPVDRVSAGVTDARRTRGLAGDPEWL